MNEAFKAAVLALDAEYGDCLDWPVILKVAIQAMREPSADMIDAAPMIVNEFGLFSPDAEAVWHAMIDELLRD